MKSEKRIVKEEVSRMLFENNLPTDDAYNEWNNYQGFPQLQQDQQQMVNQQANQAMAPSQPLTPDTSNTQGLNPVNFNKPQAPNQQVVDYANLMIKNCGSVQGAIQWLQNLNQQNPDMVRYNQPVIQYLQSMMNQTSMVEAKIVKQELHKLLKEEEYPVAAPAQNDPHWFCEDPEDGYRFKPLDKNTMASQEPDMQKVNNTINSYTNTISSQYERQPEPMNDISTNGYAGSCYGMPTKPSLQASNQKPSLFPPLQASNQKPSFVPPKGTKVNKASRFIAMFSRALRDKSLANRMKFLHQLPTDKNTMNRIIRLARKYGVRLTYQEIIADCKECEQAINYIQSQMKNSYGLSQFTSPY